MRCPGYGRRQARRPRWLGTYAVIVAVRRRVLTGPGLLSGSAAPEKPTRPAEPARPAPQRSEPPRPKPLEPGAANELANAHEWLMKRLADMERQLGKGGATT